MSIHQTIQIQSKRIAEWVMMTKNKKTSSPVHIEQYFIARAHIVQKYNPKRHLTEKYPRAVFISSKQRISRRSLENNIGRSSKAAATLITMNTRGCGSDPWPFFLDLILSISFHRHTAFIQLANIKPEITARNFFSCLVESLRFCLQSKSITRLNILMGCPRLKVSRSVLKVVSSRHCSALRAVVNRRACGLLPDLNGLIRARS